MVLKMECAWSDLTTIFTLAAESFGVHEVRAREPPIPQEFQSFHGRYLRTGRRPIAKDWRWRSGSRLMNFEYLKYRKATISGDALTGEVAFYDGFGNLETNIPLSLGTGLEEGDILELSRGRKQFTITFGNTYYDVNFGQLMAHFDSSGYMEITVNKGSARELLGMDEGEQITVVKAR